MSELLTRKELGHALGRHSRWFVWCMERAGFVMVGGRARLCDAIAWLAARPGFRASRQHLQTSANIRKHRRR